METCSGGLHLDEVVGAGHDLGLHLDRLERLVRDAPVLFHERLHVLNHSPFRLSDGFCFVYTSHHGDDGSWLVGQL